MVKAHDITRRHSERGPRGPFVHLGAFSSYSAKGFSKNPISSFEGGLALVEVEGFAMDLEGLFSGEGERVSRTFRDSCLERVSVEEEADPLFRVIR